MKEGAMSQGKPVASRTWKRQENKLSRNSRSLDFWQVTHVGFLAYKILR